MYCPASCGESREAARAAPPSRPQKHGRNNKSDNVKEWRLSLFVTNLSESNGPPANQLPHLQRPQN
eukprot:12897343-Prorocentrum_lima.AAC.1